MHMKQTAPILILVFLIGLHPNAFAQKVGWHPEFSGYLGSGLDLRNQDEPKRPVATLGTPVRTPSTGDAQFNTSFVQHQFDIARSLEVNASLSVKKVVFKGSVGVEFADRLNFSGNTIHFVFNGRRDFGETRHTVAGFTPEFVDTVTELRRTLRGEPLQRALRQRFGTHAVTGARSVARVVIVYSFEFGSQTRVQSLRTTLRASYGPAEFESTVRSFLESRDTRTTLRYRFESTDPDARPDFGPEGEITTIEQYREFAGKVRDYLYALPQARAKVVEFVTEPIANLPGYAALVGGEGSQETFNTSFDRFLDVYARLKAWENVLFEWTIEPGRMSWMNSQGQALAQTLRRDTANHLRGLEEKARRHFEQGERLEVSDDLISFFVNFGRLPLPRFGMIENWQAFINSSTGGGGNYRVAAAYVNCGPKSLTGETPFRFVTLMRNGVEVGETVAAFYSFPEFEDFMQSGYGVHNSTIVNQLFRSPNYARLRKDAENCRIGLFFYPVANDPTEWTYNIKDASGQTIDSFMPLSSPEAPCSTSVETGNAVGLGLLVGADPRQSALGRITVQQLVITNSGPGAAYGTILRIPVDTHRFELTAMSGSQGQGRYSDGVVIYEVGPLAFGSTATIRLSLIPLASGSQLPGQRAELVLGHGLTDPELADNQVQPPLLLVAPATLAAFLDGSDIELRWQSDTARLGLEAASAVGPDAVWEPLATPPVSFDGDHTLREDTGGQRRFYRLSLRN